MVSFILRDLRGSGRTLGMLFACLLLGVTLIAASGGLLQQIRSGLLADTRTLFGGDVEVSQRAPLSEEALAWLRSQGQVSLLIELRTMLLTPDGRSQVVELQSFDDNYPLYGEVRLDPPRPLNQVLARRDDTWGAAIDPLISLFALALGGIIAWRLLEYCLELEMDGVWWTALVIAPLISGVSLGLGTRHLLRRLRLSPALLLRS